jgi:hypothetical protein
VVAIVDEDAGREVVVAGLDFEVVDQTVRTQPPKSSITCWFQNRNTVHPNRLKANSFFASSSFRTTVLWLFPSTSMATFRASFPMSTLYAPGNPQPGI